MFSLQNQITELGNTSAESIIQLGIHQTTDLGNSLSDSIKLNPSKRQPG